MFNRRRVFVLALSLITKIIFAQSGEAAFNLQCEHLICPLGVDSPNPLFSWKATRQVKYWFITVGTDSLETAKGKGAMWQRRVNGDRQVIDYNGKPLQPFIQYFWSVNGRVSRFQTGIINNSNWQGEWITDSKEENLKPAAYFRKGFKINKKLISARLYIAGAGLYELYINTERIGDHILDPMFTRYDRRNLYVTYDVTNEVVGGNNVIGIHLGNGWYNMQSKAAWRFDQAPWRNRPRFCLDLRLTYSDGSIETISTDKTWSTKLSSVTFNSIYVGEHQDTRDEMIGWSNDPIDDSVWNAVIIATAPSQNIVSQVMPPVREMEKIPAVSIQKFNDSDYVFDIGKNISGISEITVQGKSGTIIQLKHAEQLDSLGHADQTGINQHYHPDDSEPFETDIYILNGKQQTLRPHFDYKGFQYVEVTSTEQINLEKGDFAGYYMHSDVPEAGRISSSNPLMDNIWSATNNAYLSNLMGYPTDCPQREKNGWTGDAHIAVETGLYNFDAITIYEKWLADIRDAQQPNGRIPAIVPTGEWWGYDNHNGPDWVSAIAIIPWELYQFYGDTKPLADNYEAIKSYVDFIDRKYTNGLCNWGLGDWVSIKSFAPVEFTSTIYYYTDALILSKSAKILGKLGESNQYTRLANKIRNAFNKKYLNPKTGNYDQGMQTELSAALFWKLVPNSLISKTAGLLRERVIADGTKLDVGLLGSKTILNALSENGSADLAYQLASSDQYPSWGYWIANGATALQEGWESGKGKGLEFSLNHIMFGEISAWMYKALGGIRIDEINPGFHHILLEPHFVSGLDSFSCYHDGPYGKIVSNWKKVKNKLFYDLTIPANSSALLTLPGKAAKRLLINGHVQYLLTPLYKKELPSGVYHIIIE